MVDGLERDVSKGPPEKMLVHENVRGEKMPVGKNASVENVMSISRPELFFGKSLRAIGLFNLNFFDKNSISC